MPLHPYLSSSTSLSLMEHGMQAAQNLRYGALTPSDLGSLLIVYLAGCDTQPPGSRDSQWAAGLTEGWAAGHGGRTGSDLCQKEGAEGLPRVLTLYHMLGNPAFPSPYNFQT